jgi:hypothetical protein
MKYMQAHLVNFMNDDTKDQEKVAEEWGKGCDAYQNHLLTILDRLPEAPKAFIQSYSLHNADFVGKRVSSDKVVLYFRDIHIQEEDDVFQHYCVLEYDIEQPVLEEKHWGPGFHEENVIWLYDEFDIDDLGRFVHNILLSDGLEMQITFKKMTWLRARIEEEY